jgi:hypothetical protein
MANQLRGEFNVQLTEDLSVDVVLNLYALNLFLNEEGAQLADLNKLMESEPLRALPKLVWCGVRTACILHDKELPMTFDKFGALFGSIQWDEISQRVVDSLQLDAKKK